MSASVKFEDNRIEVMGKINDAISAWLEEASGEIESQAKRNTPVGKIAGGNTKQNWKHEVNENAHSAVVGNMLETAIWLELGTGDYALNDDGRKGGWYILIGEGPGEISQSVVDAYGFTVVNGKDGKQFVHTYGMKPKRILHNSVENLKGKLKRRFEQIMSNIGE